MGIFWVGGVIWVMFLWSKKGEQDLDEGLCGFWLD